MTRNRMPVECSRMIRKLLDDARACHAMILAEGHIEQAVGMVGYARIAQHITEDRHTEYWVEINEIKDLHAAKRKQAIEGRP